MAVRIVKISLIVPPQSTNDYAYSVISSRCRLHTTSSPKYRNGLNETTITPSSTRITDDVGYGRRVFELVVAVLLETSTFSMWCSTSRKVIAFHQIVITQSYTLSVGYFGRYFCENFVFEVFVMRM